MLIINENLVFDSEQGYIQNLSSNVRYPIGINEITLLNFMIERIGETLTKDQLMYHVWKKRGIFVEMSSLMHCISSCRRALEDRSAEVIKTVRGSGYKFIGNVESYQSGIEPVEVNMSLTEVEPIGVSVTEQTDAQKSNGQGRTILMAAGLFFCSALTSYLIAESMHSPLSDISFEQKHFNACWFAPDSSGIKVRYQDVNLYDFGELTLLVDKGGRSLSFRPKSGVLSCE
ncbi:winged helix-turn-helix domain-containing protein [Vibrio hepatarius]|uniref:winged helix-turn-helix domain-containing protein n=1 Tax=Vibrio hepatarius TaxID=171383 RepID=UPI001C09790A|nr:winged helix-turn-helix domain-containing protein [Vibrio hepatarius]MBU2899113.1 winged helix-turn-helix domain-containing protein [Vibrio hepatarius]